MSAIACADHYPPAVSSLLQLLARVDGTTEKVLLGRFSPEGFPTIYHINGAEIREFAGHRTLQQVSCIACCAPHT